MKRIGQVIRIKPEFESKYRELHAKAWPGVLDMLKKANICNYSIYIQDDLLFAFFEYTGNDYEADMQKISDDPASIEWEKLCNECQLPYKTGGKVEWTDMEEVFHMD